MLRELGDAAQISDDGMGGKVAKLHVVEHALCESSFDVGLDVHNMALRVSRGQGWNAAF